VAEGQSCLGRLVLAGALAAGLLLLQAGCASRPPLQCRPGEQVAVQDTLYFGTARPDGPVTPGEWQDFLASVVTPRFPQGFTTWSAFGQWRGADGVVLREASHVLSLIHPRSESDDQALHEIIVRYKTAFRQESVLRSRSDVCVAF